MTLPDAPPFADFYVALNGRPPFPWQQRLAEQVVSTGEWPKEIGVPTGLGKTACLDIAIWSLAAQADRPPEERRAPTRTWWVVNRRLLVDSTHEHAEQVRERFDEALRTDEGAVTAVARRLASLSVSGRPLEVVRLRGGASFGRPTDPAQPAVILSTIPMFGSRLLFRGYGSSRSMRPIDAALAGTDSLVLVDEAHLATHLVNLLDPLAECDRSPEHPLPVPRRRPRLVSLTATGSAGAADRFDLDDADREHHIVRQRLGAAKPVEIREVKRSDAIADVAIELLDSAGRPTSCLVFANTPATARRVHERIRKALAKRRKGIPIDLELLTGRMREREAELVRGRVVGGMRSGGAPERDGHLVVVATQTLEVGADLDAELLVTECCGTRALTQRLGRMNRLGVHESPRGVYCHVPPRRDEWPIYGSEPARVLDRLRAASTSETSAEETSIGETPIFVVDLSPGGIAETLGQPTDADGEAPAILPALLWEWVKTTTPPPGEAPVEPYFAGYADDIRRVTIVWRSYLPEGDVPLWPRVRDDEAIDVPLGEARDALADLELRRLDGSRLRVERCTASELRPGDTIVLPSDAGLYDEFGWAPDATGRVADVALLRDGVAIDGDALERLLREQAPRAAVGAVTGAGSTEIDDDEFDAACAAVVDAIRSASRPPEYEAEEWSELLADLEGEIRFPPAEVPRIVRRSPRREPVRMDELDELSLAQAVRLDAHGSAVADRADAIGTIVGVRPDLLAATRLAAECHDLGKADARFQRWLDPDGISDGLVAKSDRPFARWQADRIRSGWPAGGRHEELSRRLVAEFDRCEPLEHADLIQHLVVAHHGHGRPFVMPVDDESTGTVEARVGERLLTSAANLAEADWSQPRRFAEANSAYGFWGLALLEAIVRQADHAVSSGTATTVIEVT